MTRNISHKEFIFRMIFSFLLYLFDLVMFGEQRLSKLRDFKGAKQANKKKSKSILHTTRTQQTPDTFTVGRPDGE